MEIFGIKNKPQSDSSADKKKKSLAAKTPEIIEWEKKNAGKKKVKVNL